MIGLSYQLFQLLARLLGNPAQKPPEGGFFGLFLNCYGLWGVASVEFSSLIVYCIGVETMG